MRLKFILSLLGICYIFTVSCGGGSGNSVENYTVKRGEFVISVTETGECDAVNSNMIFAPPISWEIVSSLKIVNIVEDGKQVEKGEVIIEFDKAEVEKMLMTTKSELEIAEAELRKREQTTGPNWRNLYQTLKLQRLDLISTAWN